MRVRDHGAGLLPILAMVEEADLLPDFLPKPPGLPHLERVAVERRFSPNDAMYHVFVSPWGPFPGAGSSNRRVSATPSGWTSG